MNLKEKFHIKPEKFNLHLKMHVYCINNIKRIFNEESSASRILLFQKIPLT